MSDAPPPLPASDDPHELLGVPESADEATLKRAYAALVKRYRPDRHPDEFQRVRRAYEQALEWLAFHAACDGADEVEDGDVDREEGDVDADEDVRELVARYVDEHFPDALEIPAAGDDADDEWSRTWSSVAGDGADEVLRGLASRTEEDPLDASAWALRFLVAEWRGDDDPAVHLVQGLGAGADLAGWILAVLDHDALDLAPRVSWETLSRQSDRNAAVRLLDARLVAEVTRGAAAVSPSMLRELRSRAFLDAARGDEGLRWLGLRAACAACFDEPVAADELYEHLAREPVEVGDLEEAFLNRRTLREDWTRFREAAPDAGTLRAFVTAGHSLHPVDLATLGLDAAVRAAPRMHLAAFDALAAAAPELLHLYLEGIERCLAEREEEEEEEEPDASGRADTVARLAPFVAETDQVLETDPRNRIDAFVAFLLCFATGMTFVYLGGWGIVPLLGTGAWLVLEVSRLDCRLYRRIVRPRALEAICTHGARPDDLVAAIKVRAKPFADVGRFDGELMEDVALHALALALRTGLPPDGEAPDGSGDEGEVDEGA